MVLSVSLSVSPSLSLSLFTPFFHPKSKLQMTFSSVLLYIPRVKTSILWKLPSSSPFHLCDIFTKWENEICTFLNLIFTPSGLGFCKLASSKATAAEVGFLWLIGSCIVSDQGLQTVLQGAAKFHGNRLGARCSVSSNCWKYRAS